MVVSPTAISEVGRSPRGRQDFRSFSNLNKLLRQMPIGLMTFIARGTCVRNSLQRKMSSQASSEPNETTAARGAQSAGEDDFPENLRCTTCTVGELAAVRSRSVVLGCSSERWTRSSMVDYR